MKKFLTSQVFYARFKWSTGEVGFELPIWVILLIAGFVGLMKYVGA